MAALFAGPGRGNEGGAEGGDRARQEQGVYRGRKPSYTRREFEIACSLLDQEAGIAKVAKETGLSQQTVYRFLKDPIAAETILATWSM